MTQAPINGANHAITALHASLARGTPDCFSASGSKALISAHDEYLESLGLTAIRNARVAKSDVVSATDIDRATKTLLATASNLLDWLKWVGGLALGVAIPLLVQLFDAKKSEVSTSLIVVLLVTSSFGLGATMVALALDMTNRRRV